MIQSNSTLLLLLLGTCDIRFQTHLSLELELLGAVPDLALEAWRGHLAHGLAVKFTACRLEFPV